MSNLVITFNTLQKMKMRLKNVLSTFVFLIAVMVGVIGVGSVYNVLYAQEVVLNPVEIKGKISFGDLAYDSYAIVATSGDFSASSVQRFDPKATLENYSLNVNVEQATTRKYRVIASIRSNNNTYGIPPVYVDVPDVNPSQAVDLDFIQVDLATVNVSIIVPSGIKVTSGSVRFYFNESGISLYQQIAGYKTLLPNEPTFNFPIAANAEMYIWAYIFTDAGQSYIFNIDPFSVVKDGIKNVVFEIKATENAGSIGGNINIRGPIEVVQYQTRLFGSAGNTYKDFFPQNFTPANQDNGIDWLVDNLASSTTQQYRQWLWAYYRTQGRLVTLFIDPLAYDPSDRNFIYKDQKTLVNIQANQAFIEGQLTIDGNYIKDDLTSIVVKAKPLGPGGSSNEVDLTTLYYSALGLDVGEWNINSIDFTFMGPNRSYREFITYNPHRLLTKKALTADQPFLQDLTVPMGSVTVKFKVTDGQTLSNPSIATPWPNKCSFFDSAGDLLYFWQPKVTVYNQLNVSIGEVTFHGPDAYCQGIIASATVGGSVSTFGVIDVEVVSGVDVVIDIGGPTLSLDVSPNSIFTQESLTVTGKATDDIGVTSITVNGVAAQFTSSNNPDDANEVTFSASVLLTSGENTLFTVATDNSNKTGTDTRKVFLALPSPVLACDIDENNYVDRFDIGLIIQARNTQPIGENDQRDNDGDGLITVLDARQCVLLCTLPRCATP